MSRSQSSSGLEPLPLSGCHSLIRLGLGLLFVLIAICLYLPLRLNILRQFVPDPVRSYPFIWDLKLSVYLFNGHSTSFKPANVTHKFVFRSIRPLLPYKMHCLVFCGFSSGHYYLKSCMEARLPKIRTSVNKTPPTPLIHRKDPGPLDIRTHWEESSAFTGSSLSYLNHTDIFRGKPVINVSTILQTFLKIQTASHLDRGLRN